MNLLLICLISLISLFLSLVHGLYDADEIINLPGAENLILNFKQYSGYLQIPGVSGNLTKNMHYWFIQGPDTYNNPITFWTNGGPGCSGLIGMMTEMGPFRPAADGTLQLNPYAWSNLSNMVFIESPISVGFSYSDDEVDNNTPSKLQYCYYYYYYYYCYCYCCCCCCCCYYHYHYHNN